MKIAFTLCPINYLAQAKTLGDSLIHYNPEYRFIIGLVDKKSNEIDYKFFEPHTIIAIEQIGIHNFYDLTRKFNIVELNTCVKPSFFKYLSAIFTEAPYIFYLDPDIMLFNKLTDLEKQFEDGDILLTPHITTPIPIDDLWPGEHTFLNHGLYNLGFIGIKTHSANAMSMLNWWEERTLQRGFSDVARGFYVDQLWISLVPILFSDVRILKDLGYNVAPWNLQERKKIKFVDGHYKMEDNTLLYFYHFSGYSFKRPQAISKWYTRNNFENCADVKPLYDNYDKLLKENKVTYFASISCSLTKSKIRQKGSIINLGKKIIKKIYKGVTP